jgi:hypothetical protein
MTDTETAIMIKNMARQMIQDATAKNIKPENMMRDCENFKSSRNCLLGLNQKEECSKNCRYYTPEGL